MNNGEINQIDATVLVSGGSFIGAVVGQNSGSLDSVYVDLASHVLGASDSAGGVIGLNKYTDAHLTDLISHATVEGKYNVGGIIGTNTGGSLGESRNNGSVSGEQSVGGIIGSGRLQGSALENTSLRALTNSGAVTGGRMIGGIVGSNFLDLFLTESINEGIVTATVSGGIDASAGGLIGSLTGGVNGQEFISVHRSRNTGLVNASGNYVGGLVGKIKNVSAGNIAQSWNLGEVLAESSDYVGGIVGEISDINSQFFVSQSYNRANVTGFDFVGGVAGYIGGNVTIGQSLSIAPQGSENVANIVAEFGYAGGLAGKVGLGAVVKDSYNMSNVSAPAFNERGGVVGWNQGVIDSTYNTGMLDLDPSSASPTNGLVGLQAGTVTRSYWDQEATGVYTTGSPTSGEGKTTQAMKMQATFDSWSFGSVWRMHAVDGYPDLVSKSRNGLQ